MRIYIYFVRIDLKFLKLLSKKEKKIKKNQFFYNSSYLFNHYLNTDWLWMKKKSGCL